MSAVLPKLTEAHVQQAVVQFLELDGWRAIRMEENFNERKMKRVGEAGMPDYLFIRYGWTSRLAEGDLLGLVLAEVMWIEFKRKRGLPKAHQVRWHQAEQARGALVLTVDDIDEFTRWYKASGLCRRIL